jgi:hypothetical protein
MTLSPRHRSENFPTLSTSKFRSILYIFIKLFLLQPTSTGLRHYTIEHCWPAGWNPLPASSPSTRGDGRPLGRRRLGTDALDASRTRPYSRAGLAVAGFAVAIRGRPVAARVTVRGPRIARGAGVHGRAAPGRRVVN